MAKPLLSSLRRTARTVAAVTAVVASVALVRSFRTNDLLEVLTPAGAVQGVSAQGFVQVQCVGSPTAERRVAVLHSATDDPFHSPMPFVEETLYGRRYVSTADYFDWGMLGWRVCVATRRESRRVIVQVPEWMIAGAGFLVWYASRYRAPRDALARPCVNCGYDTRANLACCSECGAAVVFLKPMQFSALVNS